MKNLQLQLEKINNQIIKMANEVQHPPMPKKWEYEWNNCYK